MAGTKTPVLVILFFSPIFPLLFAAFATHYLSLKKQPGVRQIDARQIVARQNAAFPRLFFKTKLTKLLINTQGRENAKKNFRAQCARAGS